MKILFGIFSFMTESSEVFLAHWLQLYRTGLQGCARQSCSRWGSWGGSTWTRIPVSKQVLTTGEMLHFIRRSKPDKLETLSKNPIVLKKHMNFGCLWTTGHVADLLASRSKGPFLLSWNSFVFIIISIKLGRNEDTARVRSLPLVTQRDRYPKERTTPFSPLGVNPAKPTPLWGDFIPRKFEYSDSER